MNCQYAIIAVGEIFLLEVNPCSSRAVPSVSKAIDCPLAKYAALVIPEHVAVKEVVIPFGKCPGCDVFLGPEMRSTGEGMGIDFMLPMAFVKSQIATGQNLPLSSAVFISLNDLTKLHLEKHVQASSGLEFRIISTLGSAHFLDLKGALVDRVLNTHEGPPHAAEMLANEHIQLMMFTSCNTRLNFGFGKNLHRNLGYRSWKF
ncbi:carbamoyl-phosphate synthase large chain, chloroplastic-like [Manihot esculenta]|uniref:carbamoyl-phosphate synthase large chain, chloroplastic-like n=1 Tax=Manihot esculenta TaxID=3983 RepID=UPI000B5D0929|nr:carbamoyl-phosphate synthase large chain, chloroplastic-like [Manihot esculenta]